MGPNRADKTTDSQQHTLDWIKHIEELVPTLPKSIPEVTEQDTIYRSLKLTADSPWETFKKRVNAFIGEDLRDKETGRLPHIRNA